jgi:nucleoside-diphosphate-sugar epimerase
VKADLSVCDFLNVEAVTDAIYLLLQKPYVVILNLGSGEGMSIHNIVLLALLAFGKQEREITVENSSGLSSINILDISLTQSYLGWSPGPPQTIDIKFFLLSQN